MAIMSSNIIQLLEQIERDGKIQRTGEEFERFNWGVVTVPVHPEHQEIGGYIRLGGIMGINANAQDPELAWDFISYINSEKVARVQAGLSWSLPARGEHIKPFEGVNFQAFTLLKPVYEKQSHYELTERVPGIEKVLFSGSMIFRSVYDGDLTVKEALEEFQAVGQKRLFEIRNQTKK